MYIPPSFRIDDPATLSAFMDRHSFATLVTSDEGVPQATHLPVRQFCQDGVCTKLVSHMARANPQWRHFDEDTEVLTIFQGPHAYISPSWYASEIAVPTWNYTTAHVYGIPRVFSDHADVVSLLEETVRFYEASFDEPWPGTLPKELRDQLIDSIVAFEIDVTRIEGKFKLGQNRSAEDVAGVYRALTASQNSQDCELAVVMLEAGVTGTRTDDA
ncbi:MAG: FMN-binding negative transcriptional regulator [Planctomycetaceae bacterium]|nr:FMN-binding negative transcriptional regulator [Planctomycetaceae bacterium]